MRLPRRRATAVGEKVPDVNDNTAVLLLAAPLGTRSAIVVAITKPLELMHLLKRACTAVRRFSFERDTTRAFDMQKRKSMR